jgi:hypothetical protein
MWASSARIVKIGACDSMGISRPVETSHRGGTCARFDAAGHDP